MMWSTTCTKSTNKNHEGRTKPCDDAAKDSSGSNHASTNKSLSASYRAEGNKVFASSQVEGLCAMMQTCRLKDSILLYRRALNNGSNTDEKCSASKNIGVASLKVVNLLSKQDTPRRERQYYFREALMHFDAAYSLADCKSSAWREDLLARFQQAIQDATMDVHSQDHNQRVAAMEEFADCIESARYLRAELQVEVVSVRFHEGVTALHFKEYKRCLREMHECYRPLEEAKKYGRNHESIMAEVKLREDDIYLTRCIAESSQARAIGDNLLEKLIKDEEILNMDMAWEVVDFYRQAILLTREVDVEAEAIALSRLGRVFDKVFKLKSKANEALKRSIQLAMSMKPRVFDTEDWYKECCATLERYQKERMQQESQKWNTERAPYVKEMEAELKELNLLRTKHEELLKHVYSKYPPKDTNKKLGNLPDESATDYRKQMKNLFRKAIIHFHPDHSEVEKNGKKWKVLCEEVTKVLTSVYESYKDV